ncbi:MAG: hypothetical protein ACN2B6_00190 [Rickettsiales bacterium]
MPVIRYTEDTTIQFDSSRDSHVLIISDDAGVTVSAWNDNEFVEVETLDAGAEAYITRNLKLLFTINSGSLSIVFDDSELAVYSRAE